MAKSLQDLSDSELIDVAIQLSTAISAAPAAYGATPAQIAALDTLRGTFATDVTAQVAAQAAAKAATATKEGSRSPLVAAMRGHRDTAKASGATEAQMAATALPFGGEKVPANATVPVGSVDTETAFSTRSVGPRPLRPTTNAVRAEQWAPRFTSNSTARRPPIKRNAHS